MSRLLILASCFCVGCGSLENRLSNLSKSPQSSDVAQVSATSEVTTAQYGGDSGGAQLAGILQVADQIAESPDKPLGEIAHSIVARVNGEVILAEDVFGPLRDRLAQAKQQLPAGQFAQIRSEAIRQQLKNLIERRVVIQEAKNTLPEPAIAAMTAKSNAEFRTKIETEMARMGVSTELEFRRKLEETGQSFDKLQLMQQEVYISRQFLGMQLGPRMQVSRQELLDYYEAHKTEYKIDGGVTWREILISHEKHGGSKQDSYAAAVAALGELKRGAEFGELAKRTSQGATAFQGGKWDLTAQGSYIVPSVDKKLFELPVGQISQPVEGPRGWHLVVVDKKTADSVKRFEDVQSSIQNIIREEKFQAESAKFMDMLMSKAHITTVFDTE